MTDLPPPPAWRPDPKLFNFAAEGDDAELADAPPRYGPGDALPPLDASFADATQTEGTDAFVLTRPVDASPERVADAPADNLRALIAVWRHAPDGIANAWRRAFSPPPVVHPEAWKLDVLKPNYAANHTAYERVQAAQAEELKELKAAQEKRRHDAAVALAWGFGIGAVVVLIGVVWFTTLLCLALSLAAPAVVYAFGIAGRRAQLAEARARQAIEATRGAHAAADAFDAPPARVALDRDAVTAALRNAQVISDATEIRVTPARPMRTNDEPNGWLVTIELPPSVKGGAAKALAARADIAFAFDREPSCLLMEPVKGRGLAFTMWVADRDPMACAPMVSPLIQAEQTNIHKPCIVGTDVMGERVKLRSTDDIHGLASGATGSGKSSLVAQLVANETLYPFGTSIIIDPQRSGRWNAYREVATVISGQDEDAQRLAAATLQWLTGPYMDHRAQVFEDYLALHPLASPEDIVTEAMMAIESLGLFHISVVIDEAHTVLGNFTAPFDPHDPKGPSCAQVINDAVQQGVTRSRRVGINFHVITQRGSATNVKGDIRSILNSRACFSVADDETADMGLGPGWKAAGMDPRALSTSENKGACYLRGEWLAWPRRPWVLAKLDHIDLTGHRLIAERGRALKTRLAPWVLAWVPEPVARARRRPSRPSEPVERSGVELLALLGRILEAEGRLHAPAIVARLANEDPEAYLATPATRQGLDVVLASVGLKCTRFQLAGTRDYGLRYSDLPATVPAACQVPADGSGLAEGGQA